jgi:hypothetical protein
MNETQETKYFDRLQCCGYQLLNVFTPMLAFYNLCPQGARRMKLVHNNHALTSLLVHDFILLAFFIVISSIMKLRDT